MIWPVTMNGAGHGTGEPQRGRPSRLAGLAGAPGIPAVPKVTPPPSADPDPAAARRAFAALLGEFRRTAVLVPIDPYGSFWTAEHGGVRWVCAFSDEEALAGFARARGEAGREWTYRTVLGARTGMTPHTPKWTETMEACGLSLVDRDVPDPLPTVMTAIHAVTGIDVKPAERVPDSAPDAATRLDSRWQELASEVGLRDASGEFLVIPSGGGGTSVGWVRVTDLSPRPLPSRVAAVTGSPEFVALSLDGRRLCAVTEEEDEYWIIVHTFDRPGEEIVARGTVGPT